MSGCQVGERCDSGAMLTDVSAVSVPQESPRLEDSPKAKEWEDDYEKLAECSRLRGEIARTRGLRKFLSTATAVSAGAAVVFWQLSPTDAQAGISDSAIVTRHSPTEAKATVSHSTKFEPPPLPIFIERVAGLLAVAFGLGVAKESKMLRQDQQAYANMGCEEFWVKREKKRARPPDPPQVVAEFKAPYHLIRLFEDAPISAPRSLPLSQFAQVSRESTSCSGADTLAWKCVPPRYLVSGYESSMRKSNSKGLVDSMGAMAQGLSDRASAMAVAGVALVGLMLVVGDNIFPSGASDDHLIAVYWDQYVRFSRLIFN